MLQPVFADPSNASYVFVKRIACEHQIARKTKTLLIKELQDHNCNWGCLVHTADAQIAGTISSPPTTSVSAECRSNDIDRLPPIPEQQSFGSDRTKKCRKMAQQKEQMEAEICIDWATSWPQVQSDYTLKQVCIQFSLPDSDNLKYIYIFF